MEEKKNKIYAVDFDGTLSLGKWPDVGPGNDELITFLIGERMRGDRVILWTCRENEALENAVEWCREQGLEFDAVNSNLPEVIAYYGTDSRKVSCDYFIDDKAIATESFQDWMKKGL